MTVSLTSEEIAALRQGIADGSIELEHELPVPDDVVPFRFGRDSGQVLGDSRMLQLVSERMSRLLRRQTAFLFRQQPRVVSDLITVQSYDQYQAELVPFLSLNLIDANPLRGQILIVCEPELAGALIEGFFGGRITARASLTNEFSATEERVMRRFLEAMLGALREAWRDIFALDFTLASTESHPQFAALVDGEENVIVARMHLTVGGLTGTNIDIVYPLQTLRPILPLLQARIHDDHGAPDPGWRDALQTALLDIALPVRTIIAEPVLSVAQLLDLGPGSEIPIGMPHDVSMRVHRHVIAHGVVGEAGGHVAIRISSLGAADSAAQDHRQGGA